MNVAKTRTAICSSGQCWRFDSSPGHRSVGRGRGIPCIGETSGVACVTPASLPIGCTISHYSRRWILCDSKKTGFGTGLNVLKSTTRNLDYVSGITRFFNANSTNCAVAIKADWLLESPADPVAGSQRLSYHIDPFSGSRSWPKFPGFQPAFFGIFGFRRG